MATRNYLIRLLCTLQPFPDSNNCVIPYLKSKPEELHNIKYIYFTFINQGLLISLCHGEYDDFILIVIKNNNMSSFISKDLETLLQNLTKTERKNILGINIKTKNNENDEIIANTEEFHLIDYLSLNQDDIIHKLNGITTNTFDISGLLFITDEIIARLEINNAINNVILNNNIGIRDIGKLIALFPNVNQVFLNNMKHLKDNMVSIPHLCNISLFSISNCSVSLRVLLSLTRVNQIILNCINMECQVNLYSTVISEEEWLNIWRPHNSCTNLTVISNNLTIDCIKAIIENTPLLEKFRLLDIILCKLKKGMVKSGYEKETIEIISDKNNLILNRDLKWKSLLADNCFSEKQGWANDYKV